MPEDRSFFQTVGDVLGAVNKAANPISAVIDVFTGEIANSKPTRPENL